MKTVFELVCFDGENTTSHLYSSSQLAYDMAVHWRRSWNRVLPLDLPAIDLLPVVESSLQKMTYYKISSRGSGSFILLKKRQYRSEKPLSYVFDLVCSLGEGGYTSCSLYSSVIISHRQASLTHLAFNSSMGLGELVDVDQLKRIFSYSFVYSLSNQNKFIKIVKRPIL